MQGDSFFPGESAKDRVEVSRVFQENGDIKLFQVVCIQGGHPVTLDFQIFLHVDPGPHEIISQIGTIHLKHPVLIQKFVKTVKTDVHAVKIRVKGWKDKEITES